MALGGKSMTLNVRRKVGAFTLVELLVVIAILAILSLVAFPLGRTAIEQARAAGCANHLRGLSVAVRLYANDNNQCLPFGYLPATGVVWPSSIIPYLPSASYDSSPLYCPSTSVSGTGIYKRDPVEWFTDYTCNANAFKITSPAARINECAATTIFLYDGFGGGTPAGPNVEYRHLNGFNCLFADGHVDHLTTLPASFAYWTVPPSSP